MTTVAICVPTFKRPEFLTDLLQSIALADMQGCSPHVIVADNDPDQSARSIVEARAETSAIPMAYVAEPSRGLASIRNRLIREATTMGAEFVAFVDDDQIVKSSWLRELLSVARETSAAIVVGRWEPRFEPGVSEWVRDSGFWNRSWGGTGTAAVNFGTGNVLIRTSSIEGNMAPFDERFNLIGGEDTEFFQRMRHNGHAAVWAPASLVYERIPRSRARATWMIQRGFRVGFGHGLMVKWSGGGLGKKTKRIAKSLGLIAMNSLLVIPSLARGRAGSVPRTAEIARGFGGLWGLLARTADVQEYRIVHGR